MLLAFPEACSRKVSYIKLAAVMFGLIDFFLTWHQTSNRQFKKKIKRGEKQEGKKMYPTAAFSIVHHARHLRAYAPKCIKARALPLTAFVNGGGSLRLEAAPKDRDLNP